MMYHCRLRFYLTGCRREWADIIRAIPPLKGFTHEFIESGEPEAVLAAGADGIWADWARRKRRWRQCWRTSGRERS